MNEHLKDLHMTPTMTALGEIFDVRVHQVGHSHAPEWPWMEGDKPVIPAGPEGRTHENYKRAAAYLVYKMEVHRGAVSERKRKPEMEGA